MDTESLLATLPTVDVSPDLVIMHASTESLLTVLPSIDLTPEAHAFVIVGIAVSCDVSAKTVTLRNR